MESESRLTKKLTLFLVSFWVFLPFSVLADPVQCECVRALREIRGVNIRGAAWLQQPNTPLIEVQIGDVVIQKIGKVSHVSLVIAVDTEGAMYRGRNVALPTSLSVWECNYSSCKCGTRTIPIFDKTIRGILRTT